MTLKEAIPLAEHTTEILKGLPDDIDVLDVCLSLTSSEPRATILVGEPADLDRLAAIYQAATKEEDVSNDEDKTPWVRIFFEADNGFMVFNCFEQAPVWRQYVEGKRSAAPGVDGTGGGKEAQQSATDDTPIISG